jgi:TPR repeat protein
LRFSRRPRRRCPRTTAARGAFDAGRFDEARHLWMARAAAGDAEAALNLGLLYDLGRGVPQNSLMAFSWYLQAAEAGLAQAAFNVAVMLDGAEAALWYAMAAAAGYHRAQYALVRLARGSRELRRNLRDTRRAAGRAAALRVARLRGGKVRRALCYQPLELVLNRQGRGELTPCRSRRRARRRAYRTP